MLAKDLRNRLFTKHYGNAPCGCWAPGLWGFWRGLNGWYHIHLFTSSPVLSLLCVLRVLVEAVGG